jgi:hypothetical protein
VPTVWLDRYECRDGELPPVCMVCGAEATTTSRQTFRWHPPWVLVLILAGVLIWAIVAIILTKTMTVYALVCDEHKGHWFKRKLIGWRLVLLGLAAFCVGFLMMALVNDPRFGDFASLGPLLGAAVFFATLIAAVLVLRSAIRPTEITDDDIRLTGVSEGFVEALREQRREERDRDRARRRKRDEGSGDKAR